jgi:hypothetical protein
MTEIKMILPDEFKHFCRQFHQDIDITDSSLDELLEAAIEMLNNKERSNLREFLQKQLTRTDAELGGVWNASPAEVFFRKPSQIRFVFIETIKKL